MKKEASFPPDESRALVASALNPLVPANGYFQDYEEAQDGPDFFTIWRILYERRLVVLGGMIAGLALAIAFSLFQTPLFRSTATLELNPPTIPIMTGAQGDQNLEVPNTDYEFLPTQYGLLKSTSLAEHVVEDLNLLKDGGESATAGSKEEQVKALAARLAGGLQVDPVPGSRLVEISYTSDQAGDAAKVVNGFAHAFINSTLERRYEATATARDFLSKRLAIVKADLDESEKRLVVYAKANGIINTGQSDDLGSDANSLPGASLVALNSALADAQQRRITAEQRYRATSNAGQTAEVSERTASLREERAKLEAEYREKSTYLKDDYPDMVRLKSRMAALDESIRSEASNVSGSRNNSLRADFQAALAEERALQSRVNQLKGSVLDLRERSIDYNILKRELDTNKSLYDSLLGRYNELGVAGSIDTPQASLVDEGRIPGAPFSPNIPRNVILGLILGLGAGAVLAFALYYVTDRITTPEDVREKLKLPPIGVIPNKKRREELGEVLADRRSPISEAYASLVTTLQFTTSSGIPRSIVVTSTVAEEGKSTTSFVLARSLAENGKRVLLIDADMRKPSFVIEESADTGLSQLVVDGGGLDRHILKTSLDNMWLMPSGPMPPNPVRVLNSERMQQIIDSARDMFDVVIIDAPPAYGFADAPLLAGMCDAVLLVVESGKPRRKPAIEVIERLRATGSLIIGAVLSKYRLDASGYGYRYYEAYGENAPKLEPHELAVGLISRGES